MYKDIYVFSFANGRDIVASASDFKERAMQTLKVGTIYLPEVFNLTKPRLIMMHQTASGIQVGMAPVNIDDTTEAEPIPFMRNALAYCYSLPDSSKLAKNYLQSISSISLATNLATNPFKAH